MSVVGASLVLGSIPSPSSRQLDLGPISLNYYGLCIGIGVLAAVFIGQRRWVARGGHPDDVAAIATWAVPAGLVGTRIYHVITDWRSFEDWFRIWEGGLGIPGGLMLGIPVGIWVAKRRGLVLGEAIDAIVPSILVAQAIGRLGNWFNQEIFGGPSDLPWAVEIDSQYRPAEFADSPTFHPTFLYEGVWNLSLFAFLSWIDRRGVLKRGMLLPLYVGGYGIGRFLVESVRIDDATTILGIRVNHWMSAAAVVGAAAAILFLFRKAAPSFYAPGGLQEQRLLAQEGEDAEELSADADADADADDDKSDGDAAEEADASETAEA
jgi:prolipoprotein diacylglyceryl transferase